MCYHSFRLPLKQKCYCNLTLPLPALLVVDVPTHHVGNSPFGCHDTPSVPLLGLKHGIQVPK